MRRLASPHTRRSSLLNPSLLPPHPSQRAAPPSPPPLHLSKQRAAHPSLLPPHPACATGLAARADRLQGGRAGTARQATVLQCGEAGEVDGAQTVLRLQCWESGGARTVRWEARAGEADGQTGLLCGEANGALAVLWCWEARGRKADGAAVLAGQRGRPGADGRVCRGGAGRQGRRGMDGAAVLGGERGENCCEGRQGR